MENKFEFMKKFLYSILKQVDLNKVDWKKVSSELSITSGHAAYMRYSRFKNSMEGKTPVRRTRKPKGKKNTQTEVFPRSADQMQASNPTIASITPTPENVIKSEPREDRVSPLSPEIPIVTPAASYDYTEMQVVQTITLPCQESKVGFSQIQLPQSLYQMVPQAYGAAGQTLGEAMMNQNCGNFPLMDIYNVMDPINFELLTPSTQF